MHTLDSPLPEPPPPMLSKLISTIQRNEPPNPDEFYSVSCFFDIIWTVISIILRLTSIAINIVLVIEYYEKKEYNYFAWTICCIVIPLFVTSIIGVYMYLQDRENPFRKRYSFFGILIYVIILPFLFRYWQSLLYAIASKNAERRGDRENQKKYYKFMIEEESDISLMRIFECFLEAAPQKILQISIILSQGAAITLIQLAAISSCVCSATWCVAGYHKYNRYIQADKEPISIGGLIVQCIWHFLITVSRVLCLSVIASTFPLWTLTAFCVRIGLTSLILLIFDKPSFCSETIFHSLFFSIVLAVVYIFTYILPKEGRTRYRFAIYYFLCMLENIACVTLYIVFSENIIRHRIFFVPLCVFSILPYIFGIGAMVLYYTKCHPNLRLRASTTPSSPQSSAS